jgi:predicted nucleic acid-binding protein
VIARRRIAALDSGALIALSRGDRSAIALLKALRQEQTLLIIPAPVLAEVLRGNRADAAIHRILNCYSDEIVPTSAEAAKYAGELLGRAGASSTMTMDALIGATALEYKSTDLLTADEDDHRRLLGEKLDIIPV